MLHNIMTKSLVKALKIKNKYQLLALKHGDSELDSALLESDPSYIVLNG